MKANSKVQRLKAKVRPAAPARQRGERPEAEPRSQGRETCSDYRLLGTCPAVVQGSADITSLYTARFGVPPVAKKVYIQVNQFVNGWESLPRTFWSIVPAAA